MFLGANKDKDAGENGEWDQKGSVDEFLYSKIAQHCDLEKDQGSHEALVDMWPDLTVGLIFRNQNFQHLLVRKTKKPTL